MDAANAYGLIGAVAALAGMTGGSMIAVFKFGGRMAKLEERVEVMWGFTMSRAIEHGINAGRFTQNSPVAVAESSKAIVPDDLAADLRSMYARLKKPISDNELRYQIERRFNQRLIQEVCRPNGLHDGQCLIIAAAVAKGE